jgi:hypothetical protein
MAEVREDVVGCTVADHCVQDDEGFKHDLSTAAAWLAAQCNTKPGRAYYDVGLPKPRRKGLADIMNCAILRPCRGDDWVKVLRRMIVTKTRGKVIDYRRTFGLGGAAFGLQASLTTLS